MVKNKNIIAAIIVSAGLIISALIYAFANRYQVENRVVIDKWTGKAKVIKFEKS